MQVGTKNGHGYTGTKKKVAYCVLYCRNIYLLGQQTLSKRENTIFSNDGFNNWNTATQALEKHANSAYHKECQHKWLHMTTGKPIDVQLNTQKAKEQINYRHCLLKIFSSLKFIGQQGLAIHGHTSNTGTLCNFFT